MDKIPMTITGHQALMDEHADLKKVQRPQVIQDIAEARAHGDLSENAEYHAAKERQSFIEGRI
jgi:transcription elongation factor GreA